MHCSRNVTLISLESTENVGNKVIPFYFLRLTGTGGTSTVHSTPSFEGWPDLLACPTVASMPKRALQGGGVVEQGHYG